MNADQKANVETMVTAISETLFSAWSYFHLLQGLHSGSKSHPVVVQRFDRFFDQVWRAVFDGFFSKAGALIDRTKNTYSLPNLVKLSIRYGDAELKANAKSIQSHLAADTGPLKKIESWRHNVVAHRTLNGRADDFYQFNKMNLSDVSDGLRQIERLLNELSLRILRTHNDTETGSLDIIRQGNDLFAHVAGESLK